LGVFFVRGEGGGGEKDGPTRLLVSYKSEGGGGKSPAPTDDSINGREKGAPHLLPLGGKKVRLVFLYLTREGNRKGGKKGGKGRS